MVGPYEGARVEFFLPYILMDEPVDTWEYQSVADIVTPIGKTHHVAVRSLDRLDKNRCGAIMEQRMRMDEYRSCPIPAGGDPYDVLGDQDDDVAAFVCTHRVARHGQRFWQGIDQSAVPYGLWIRSTVENNTPDTLPDTLLMELNTIIAPPAAHLPKLVRTHRFRLAAGRPDAVDFGGSIGLYFENRDSPAQFIGRQPNRQVGV